MKEIHYFYAPEAATSHELPPEEAAHAVRVLRLKEGDTIMLMDGQGSFYKAEVTMVSNKHCLYDILETIPQQPQWKGHFHLGIAPTKMMDRMEWMLEKVTEVGIDRLTLLDCQFSERHIVKLPRLEKIAVSAVKQSHKAWIPQLEGMVPFKSFISAPREGRKYIAHCYEEIPRTYLFDELQKSSDLSPSAVTVLIGPEGDFSIDEVRQAVEAGFVSVHLGKSRLRTETAGLAAVMMMQLAKK
jgi:16S rRNA (uracil1498-N3)-methyltransferase